jgi:TonB family protein
MLALVLSGLKFHKPDQSDPYAAENDRFAFEVIEVPDATPEERPVEPSNLVSDRAARAADMHLEDSNTSADPYADGDTGVREFEEAGGKVALARQEVEPTAPDFRPPPHEPEDGDLQQEILPEQIADYVVDEGNDSREADPGRPVSFRNLLSDVGRTGGLSFNTYEWDFAPYMLAMKRAIESHLFPPYAFTHMGLVSGTNVVRFTVMPDGRLRSLEVLGSDAHISLDRTSVRAIETSVPFLPLPRDFPEEYLEVTARFSYLVRDKK